jgi:hypothetical protein
MTAAKRSSPKIIEPEKEQIILPPEEEPKVEEPPEPERPKREFI